MHIGGETSQIYESCKEKKRKIKIIEDCSQAPFARVYGTKNIPYVIKNLLAHLGILVFFLQCIQKQFHQVEVQV